VLDGSPPRRLVASVALASIILLAGAVAALTAPQCARAGTLQTDRQKAQRLASEISSLDVRIDDVVARYATATRSLRAVHKQISENKQLQRLAENELALARATLAARAVSLYKHDDATPLDAIFTADNFSDLISQLTMIHSVARSDRDVLNTVVTTKRELADRAVSLAADRLTAEKLVAERRAELKSIRSQLAERKSLLSGVRAEIRGLATKIADKTPSSEPTPTPASDDDGQGSWWPLIQKAAAANGVNPHGMYRLMMIESGGNASIVGPGGYYGLFQYAPTTWKGSWNPYRSASITDGAAQIRATALALKLGYGHAWWDPSYSLAFGG
jgi:peptidoglycan hydrolase CwlO-like protein